MNRKLFIIMLTAIMIIFGINSCFSNNESGDKNTLNNSLDWKGVYAGSYLTNNGNVINVRIKLNKEQTFEANYQYVDGSNNTIDIKGRFQWDDTGSIIMIDVIDVPIRYKVAKNKLIRLEEHNFVLDKVQ
jgi:hypothetical protein